MPRAKLIAGCLSVALLFSGCSKNVERAASPVSANVQQVSSPTPDVKTPPAPLPAPAGWVPYPVSQKPDGLDNLDWRCAGYSEREWRVVPGLEGVEISRLPNGPVQDPLPFDIRPQKAEAGLAGHRRVKRVGDGWLVGFDAGEFGGALWWFSADGSERKKLADENVVGFADGASGVLALVGLYHMGLNYGKLLLVREGQGGDRRVEVVADLGAAPAAYAMEPDGSLLVATHRKLIRARTTGGVEQLHAPANGFIYPNSMTLSVAGVLHIGMRHFVLRLSPAGGGYKEEWFVPSECSKFELRDYDCVCRNRRGS